MKDTKDTKKFSDGDSSQRDEDITYTFTADAANTLNSKLERRDALDASAQLVADRIKDLQFQYYDDTDTLLAVPLSAADAVKVCKIRITVTVIYSQRKIVGGIQDLTYSVSTDVLVQNNPTNISRF